MKRDKILARLLQAAEEKRIVAVRLRGCSWDMSVWPLRVSDEIALCANDSDFELNGWDAFAIDAIERVDFRYDKYAEFAAVEGVLDAITDLGMPVDNWQSFFAALPADQLAGVEREHVPEDEARYAVGRVVKAGKKRVHLMCLDSEAVWAQPPWRIRYQDISAVRIGDRYLTVFGKYAGDPPAGGMSSEERPLAFL